MTRPLSLFIACHAPAQPLLGSVLFPFPPLTPVLLLFWSTCLHTTSGGRPLVFSGLVPLMVATEKKELLWGFETRWVIQQATAGNLSWPGADSRALSAKILSACLCWINCAKLQPGLWVRMYLVRLKQTFCCPCTQWKYNKKDKNRSTPIAQKRDCLLKQTHNIPRSTHPARQTMFYLYMQLFLRKRNEGHLAGRRDMKRKYEEDGVIWPLHRWERGEYCFRRETLRETKKKKVFNPHRFQFSVDSKWVLVIPGRARGKFCPPAALGSRRLSRSLHVQSNSIKSRPAANKPWQILSFGIHFGTAVVPSKRGGWRGGSQQSVMYAECLHVLDDSNTGACHRRHQFYLVTALRGDPYDCSAVRTLLIEFESTFQELLCWLGDDNGISWKKSQIREGNRVHVEHLLCQLAHYNFRIPPLQSPLSPYSY